VIRAVPCSVSCFKRAVFDFSTIGHDTVKRAYTARHDTKHGTIRHGNTTRHDTIRHNTVGPTRHGFKLNSNILNFELERFYNKSGSNSIELEPVL
jgi:hypothetical protein